MRPILSAVVAVAGEGADPGGTGHGAVAGVAVVLLAGSSAVSGECLPSVDGEVAGAVVGGVVAVVGVLLLLHS